MHVTWTRRVIPRTGNSYEVSSKGDARFSAFNAIMPDGRSLECHYQLDAPPYGKGYQPGGVDWRLGKGKPALDTNMDLYAAYLNLWRIWARDNLPLLRELWQHAMANGHTLSDCFATTPVNQAHALADILNDLATTHGKPTWLST